jgi:hypothetical protein
MARWRHPRRGERFCAADGDRRSYLLAGLTDLRTTVRALFALALALALAGAAAAEDEPKPPAPSTAAAVSLEVSLAGEYTEGKYGTRHTTEILRVPLTVDWFVTDRLDFSLTVPYLWEHGQSILALLGGRGGRAQNGIGLPPRGRRQALFGRSHTEEGLGDVLLDGTFVLLEEKSLLPEVATLGEVKFPTADSNKGLGTGEFDETVGLDLTKGMGESWTTYVDLSYTFVGSPPGTRVDDFFGWSVGLGYAVTRALRFTGYVDGSTATVRNPLVEHRLEKAPRDVRLRVEYTPTKLVRLRLEGLYGLSSGTPAFGAIAGVTLRF